MPIVILHNTTKNSDKIWACSTTPNPDGKFRVWFGRRDSMLQCRNITTDGSSGKRIGNRIQEKLDNGYIKLDGTISKKKYIPNPEQAIRGLMWSIKGNPNDLVNVIAEASNTLEHLPDVERLFRRSVAIEIVNGNVSGFLEEDSPQYSIDVVTLILLKARFPNLLFGNVHTGKELTGAYIRDVSLLDAQRIDDRVTATGYAQSLQLIPPPFDWTSIETEVESFFF